MRDEYTRTPDAETLVRAYGLPYVGAIYKGNAADGSGDADAPAAAARDSRESESREARAPLTGGEGGKRDAAACVHAREGGWGARGARSFEQQGGCWRRAGAQRRSTVDLR